jgi:hypothetical protein
MRAFTFLVSLLLPAIAVGLLESTMQEEGIVPDETAMEDIGSGRVLKKGKGAAPGGSKGAAPSASTCQSIRVYYNKADYVANLKEITSGNRTKSASIGFTVDQLEVYDVQNRPVGFITETNIVTGTYDCTANGAFSFARRNQKTSKDQIFYQGTFISCCALPWTA